MPTKLNTRGGAAIDVFRCQVDPTGRLQKGKKKCISFTCHVLYFLISWGLTLLKINREGISQAMSRTPKDPERLALDILG